MRLTVVWTGGAGKGGATITFVGEELLAGLAGDAGVATIVGPIVQGDSGGGVVDDMMIVGGGSA